MSTNNKPNNQIFTPPGMKVLITGGSCFIGRHIVMWCRNRGLETVSFDTTKKNSDSDKHVTGTALDFRLLKESMQSCDAAFQFVATTSPPQFE